MEREIASGPELADGAAGMSSPHRAPAGGTAPAAAPAARFALRSLGGGDLLPLAYLMLVASVLAASGYPAWRLAVVALAAGIQQVHFLAWRRGDVERCLSVRHCVNADEDQIARFVVLSQASFFVTTGVTAAVTGGVRSPLLIPFVGAYFAAVVAVGDRRPTRFLLAATALGICTLALLPDALTGPVLPTPVHGALTAIGLMGVGAVLAPVHARMRRKREELARARKEMAADALARVQSLEQIGAKVAHELKNPLAGVKALVQLGLRNPREAASHGRLEVVDREVGRMQEILQNYLSFTRPLQAVTPRSVRLGPLVSDTLEVLSARADDAGVRLYAQGDATSEADPRRLKEALLNLVANAIEATPRGGEVAVEVKPLAEEVEIVVRDTGRGMPVETLRRLGTPFFTTREDGTGLGVVLARSVISQHGGSLRYESEPGRGTRVRVTLPRAARGAADAARAAR